jgi:hypothetical protein
VIVPAEVMFPVVLMLPVTLKDPVIIVLPEMVELVFTTNPKLGEIDAVALPDAILERFNPTIPEAGMLKSCAPDPEKDPDIALALTNVSTVRELRLATEPEATTFFHDGIFSSNYGWLQLLLPTSSFEANNWILFLETN